MAWKNNNKLSAFSLIELSIVILIIGILVAGVTQSSRLVAQFRLSTAKNLTNSSPVSSIKGLIAWYETTSDKSLDDGAREDGTAISSGSSYSWYDINPQTTTKNNASSTSGPLYVTNCINSLPCLQFGSPRYLNSSQNFGSTTELSIFMVFKTNTIGTLPDFIVTRGAFVSNDNSFTYALQNTVNRIYYRSTNTGASNSYVLNTLTANTNYIGGLVDDNTTVTHYLNDTVNASTVTNGIKSLIFSPSVHGITPQLELNISLAISVKSSCSIVL